MHSQKLRQLLPVLVAALVGLTTIEPLTAAETSISVLAKNTHFHGIAVDRGDPSRLYLATHHGIFAVAPDGSADRISSNRDDYMGFTPHPTDPNVLFGSGHPAGGGNSGFIVSTDGGKTWTKRADGVRGPVDFHQMDVSKADPNVIYGVFGALQVSRNGGRSWTIVGPGPEISMDLAASAVNVDTLYAATRNGILRSKDGGRSWSPAHLLKGPATMVDVAANGNLYAFQVGTGLITASESDLNWKLLSNGFGESVVFHIAVDPSNKQKMYAVTLNPQTGAKAIVASGDGGVTWKALGGE